MTDKTLREDFSDLRVTVEGFCASQATWNELHDKHSRDVVKGLMLQIDSSEKVNNAKISGVEKRVKWIMGLIAVAFALMIGFCFKIIYSYLTALTGAAAGTV